MHGLTSPVRGAAVRECGLLLPPDRMPLWRNGRPLKRWRYVGVYTPQVMLCAGHARVGPLSQRWWAVAEPDGSLRERSSIGRAGVTIAARHVNVNAPGVRVELRLGDGQAVETASPTGERGNYIWTSKRAGIPVEGTVVLDGREHEIDGPHGFIDDSAGYHPRHTVWRWSAGLGRTAAGQRVGWNLASGIHDRPAASERTLWVDGQARELGAVEFAGDLSQVSFAEGGRLRFHEWAAREERRNLLLVRSSYRQPFGTFSGELPGALQLREGCGVMEEHDVWW